MHTYNATIHNTYITYIYAIHTHTHIQYIHTCNTHIHTYKTYIYAIHTYILKIHTYIHTDVGAVWEIGRTERNRPPTWNSMTDTVIENE